MWGLSIEFMYCAFQINAEFLDASGSPRAPKTGTGFIIAKDKIGYLITNRHVVDIGWSRPGSSINIKQNNDCLLNKLTITGRPIDDNVMNLKLDSPSPTFDIIYEHDVAVIPLRDLKAENRQFIEIKRYFDVSLLAQEGEFDGEVNGINVGDQLVFPVYAGEVKNESQRPALRHGWIASDPRKQLDMPSVKGDAILTEAFSTSGASGAPVFVVQKGIRGFASNGNTFRDARLIGVNAGHVGAAEHTHANLSYAFKSTVILKCISIAESKPSHG